MPLKPEEEGDKVGMSKVGRRTIWTVLGSRNSYSVYVIFLAWGLCTLFYYFGELVDLAGWEGLRWEFFYGVHDAHRLLFLGPIIYAGYIFGKKAAIIITIIVIMTLLPRALFVSPFPDPLLRTGIFVVVAGVMGYITAKASGEYERRRRLETLLPREKEQILRILEKMEEGAFITGPDYRIRFMNSSMMRDFGTGLGSYCYQYLHKLNSPCPLPDCRLASVIKGAAERWEYQFPDGRTYEVQASPYIDSDAAVCQLAVFRNLKTKV